MSKKNLSSHAERQIYCPSGWGGKNHFSLSIFGSALRDDFGPHSDLDFLISFDPEAPWSLWDLVTMRAELSELTGHEVDLVEKEGIRNPYRRNEILTTKEVIHAT